MHISIIERNTFTIDTILPWENPLMGKTQQSSLDKILQQDTKFNLTPSTSYTIMIQERYGITYDPKEEREIYKTPKYGFIMLLEPLTMPPWTYTLFSLLERIGVSQMRPLHLYLYWKNSLLLTGTT